MIDLARTREAMAGQGVDAWVLWDFRGSNPVLWQVLGVAAPGTSRRVVLVVGADGDPVLAVSPLDRNLLLGLPVRTVVYRTWGELFALVEDAVRGAGRVAMEYSPGAALPAVGWADAGAVELVRSFGAEVVSSGDLFQAVAAALDDAAEASHLEAVGHVVELHALVRGWAAAGIGRVTERELASRVLIEMARRGLETEGSPGVCVGPGAGDPHHEPSDVVVGPDAVLLVDLWARLPGERNVFGDVTWMSFTGPQPPADVLAAFDAVRAGRDAALALVRDAWDAGRALRGFEVDRATRAAIEAAGHGAGIVHRTGHSLSPGPRVHGLGANLDDLETHDDRTLAPGTAFTIEPGVYGPRFGIRLECDVHLHPDRGPVVTTPLQDELTLLGV